MSAVFGIYNFDGKPVYTGLLKDMSDRLSHRGRDGEGIWVSGCIGLGHRMLWTAPESEKEVLPQNIDAGCLVITADARLDNRNDLIRQLNLAMNQTRETISDSEIILFSYKKWGAECPAKLIGDFAFVIWDERQSLLFCARDRFGVKPFYYYKSKNSFAFATEIKSLFSLPEVSKQLDEETIADYLINNYENKSTTFYQQIKRLPPASTLIINANSECRLRSYYFLEPDREISLKSNEEYAEGLREIFTEAVRSRVRSARRVGAYLSGGLDSSSIACVARNLLIRNGKEKLPTFSLIYDQIKECDERRYIDLVLAQGGFKSYLIPGDEDTPLSNLETICRHLDRPSIGPGGSASWRINKVISETGVRVILDGHDGDSAISYGYKYLDELAQLGRWFALAAEARKLAPVFRMAQWKIIKAYVHQYRWRPFLRNHPKIKKISNLGHRFLPGETKSILNKRDRFALQIKLINKDFAKRVKLEDRYKDSLPRPARNAREEQYQMITSGGQVLALEESDSLAAAFGIEPRYPFWDKRLIEYCLALPGQQKCYNGYNRVVMRRAMNDVLPPEVCWRRDKTDFTPNFIAGLFFKEQKRLQSLPEEADRIIYDFFDSSVLRKTYQKLTSQSIDNNDIETRMTLRAFWDIESLLSWLKVTPH